MQTFFSDMHEDHEAIRDLAASFQVERDPRALVRLGERLEQRLHIHLHIEEHVIFAYLLREVKDEEARIAIHGSIAEHSAIMHMRRVLLESEPGTEGHLGRAYALEQLLQTHFDREEARLYEVARDHLSFEDLSFLKDRIREARDGFEAELKATRRR